MRKTIFIIALLMIKAGAIQAEETNLLSDKEFWLPLKIENEKYTNYFFEYSRGASTSVKTDINIKYGNTDVNFQGVLLEPEAYPWGYSQYRFFSIIFGDDQGDLIGAFTEPYYAMRISYFLKRYPYFGFGLEHTHFKVFLNDLSQNVTVKGTVNGSSVNQTAPISNYMSMFSISHGVNHLGFTAFYRLMLYKTPEIPDGYIQPYISLSIGPAVPHVEIIYLENDLPVAETYNYQLSLANWGFSLNLGSRFKFTNNIGCYLESKVAYSILNGMTFEGDNGEGEIDTSFLTYHIQFGLTLAL
ncbi:MAG: hypothetical protein OEZ13_05180 [Spirochaetia bacterium]|nr:hypothetical protein [Spirochaetia bacterium]